MPGVSVAPLRFLHSESAPHSKAPAHHPSNGSIVRSLTSSILSVLARRFCRLVSMLEEPTS